MKSRKIIWQIFPATLCILIFAIIAITWYSTNTIENYFLKETENELAARGHLVDSSIQPFLQNGQIKEIQNFVIKGGRESGTRITIIDRSGKVIADSNESPDVMNNHKNRPEVQLAMDGQIGSSLRHSETLNNILLYVAIPSKAVSENNKLDSVIIRTSLSVSSLYNTISDIKKRVAIGSLGIILIAGFITLLISRNISRPLEKLEDWARNFAEGNLQLESGTVQSGNASQEVINLANTMAQMGKSLDEKIASIDNHRNQLQTVFSSMQESIIAIDHNDHIVAINNSASKLFEIDGEQPATGRLIEECIRDISLLEQLNYVLEKQQAISADLEIQKSGKTIFLQSNIVPLIQAENTPNGALIVLNNVTRVRQLESVRKDFVANVSHELRTPITAIQGYVETLLDGALDNRGDAEQFLKIVLRQSSRLSAIINDLLALSKIEQDSEGGNVELYEIPLHLVLEASIQTCEIEAKNKNIRLTLDCPQEINLSLNAALLEQAIINLIVNAIHYSNENDVISINAILDTKNQVKLTVSDNGCGIKKEHLPRLFERFYRSDPARSRDQGGTGLGLAIVKHIVNSHAGTVEVESEEGVGSKFIISLPA